MMNLEVKGYAEAKQIMDQLASSMQKKILLPTLRTSARPMLRSARSLAPKRTGTLQKKLKIVRFRRVERKSEVAIAIKHVFEKTKKGKVNEFYGLFVHEGTKDMEAGSRRKKGNAGRGNRGKKGGKPPVFVFEAGGKKVFACRRKGIAPNPYIERAYEANQESLIRTFGDTLAHEVGKFVSKNFKPVR